jgi:hypothetical protein
MMKQAFFAGMAALLLTGCTATIAPVQVTRFHLGQQIPGGGISIESVSAGNSNSLELGTYAAAVRRQLTIVGLTEGEAIYSAIIDQSRTIRETAKPRSPFSIGIGGGTSIGGVGVGAGTSIPLGSRGTQQVVVSRLSVTIKRRADQTVIWEGRAETEAPATAPAAQPGLAADKLAKALFSGFPGRSGETITVP